MWWFGVYLGDGYLKHSDGYTMVEIAVDRTDTELVDEIVRVTTSCSASSSSLAATASRLHGPGTAALAEFLELNGFGGSPLRNESPTGSSPFPLASGSRSSPATSTPMATCATTRKNHDVSLTSANEALLFDVKDLLALCGIGGSAVNQFRCTDHSLDPARLSTGHRLSVERPFRPSPVSLAAPSHRMGCTRSSTRTVGQGHHVPLAHERHARFRSHRVDRVGRCRARVRHRGARPPQLRGRGLRGAQLRSRVPQEPRGPRAARDPVHRHGRRAPRVPRPRAASTSARSSRPATTSSPR